MKVLIIGEFSGFAKHLKNGFKALGHNVTVVTGGDSFKKILGDKDDIRYGRNLSLFGYPIKGSARFLHLYYVMIIIWKLWKQYRKKCPDLIIVINGVFITTSIFKLGTPLYFVKKQLQRGAKMILTECGYTPAGLYNHQKFWQDRGKKIKFEDDIYSFLLDYSYAIIPTNYSYYEDLLVYADYHYYETNKIIKPIPLPITIDKNCKIVSCVGRKILIFHGLIRPEFKGTSFILEAMDRLQKEMPNNVECVVKGGMPYDDYIKLFDRIDILVDQTYGNGWGMNAIIGAMNGKCVLTPCGKENSETMGIPDIPFVQIGPDSEQIYRVLKDLVLHPDTIDNIKLASIQFANKYCESSIIAKRYLEVAGIL